MKIFVIFDVFITIIGNIGKYVNIIRGFMVDNKLEL